MGKSLAAVWLMLLPGCGRIGFDPAAAIDGANSDGTNSDGTNGDAPFVQSCSTLPPTCGPTGTSPCCETLPVPGGAFYRSYDGVGHDDMGYPAMVSSFRLDKFEVTVGRFRQFVNAGMGTQQNPPAVGSGGRTLNGLVDQGGWEASYTPNLAVDTAALIAAFDCSANRTWTDLPGGNELRPINCVSWYEAMAFCIWDGGFLPTAAERNYAASGGDLQRAFPWSNPPADLTINATHASYFDGTDCVGDGLPGCSLTDLIPVGTRPAGDGAWGHSDLGGNIWEWGLDWYEDPYPTTTCIDCANLTASTFRVLGGGSYFVADLYLRVGRRDSDAPDARLGTLGIRCARRA